MTEREAVTKKDQKPRHRSPNYPAISLRAAIGKIETLYKADGLAASPKLAALKHMGYDRLHSEAARTLSALKSYGLVEEANDRIKLTQRGIEIVARPVGDDRRTKAIKDCAIRPEIYQEVLEEYRLTGLPSDSSLKSDLITIRKFNPSAVDGFVRDFRDTLELAGLTKVMDQEPKTEDDDGGIQQELPQIGDFVQWESNGQIQFQEPRRIRAFSQDGNWAFLEGSDTGLPKKELTVVLVGNVDKALVQFAASDAPDSGPEQPSRNIAAPQFMPPPKMRSYSWALSGDFSAKLELFGDAHSDEDIDALAEYVEITIRALKRSLKAQSVKV